MWLGRKDRADFERRVRRRFGGEHGEAAVEQVGVSKVQTGIGRGRETRLRSGEGTERRVGRR